MEKKWRVGHVELLEGGALFGFVLYDQKDRPCVSIGYSNDVEAFAGRDLVLAALKDAEEVRVAELERLEYLTSEIDDERGRCPRAFVLMPGMRRGWRRAT